MAFNASDRERFDREVRERNAQSQKPVSVTYASNGASVWVGDRRYTDAGTASRSTNWNK